MGMGVFLFAPAGNLQRVLKRQQSLYLRWGKKMFHFQIVMELGEVLQLINTADVLCVQQIRMDFQAVIQTLHQHPFCFLFQTQISSFPAGRVIVQSTSLPQTSHPGVF